MQDVKQAHYLAAMAAMDAAKVCNSTDEDLALNYYMAAFQASKRATDLEANPLIESIRTDTQETPAGGDRHREEAFEAISSLSFVHMLAAFPDQWQGDQGESGWQVDIWLDRDGDPAPADESEARRVMKAIGGKLDLYRGSDSEDYHEYIVTLPNDYAIFLRRRGMIFFKVNIEGYEWSVYTELDPR